MNRTVASGWNTASSGYEWINGGTGTGSSSMLPGVGLATVDGFSSRFQTLSPTFGPWSSNTRWVMTFSFQTDTIGPTVGGFDIMDADGLIDVFYGTSTTGVVEVTSGANDDTEDKTDWLPNTLYNARLEYIPNSVVRARVWQAGTIEPTSWNASTTAMGQITSALTVAMRAASTPTVLRFSKPVFAYDGWAYVFDNFNRVVAVGFGTSSSGSAWTVVSNPGTGTFSVNGLTGLIVPDGSNAMSIKADVPVTSLAGYTMRTLFTPGAGTADLTYTIQNAGLTLTTSVGIKADITSNSFFLSVGGGTAHANVTWTPGTQYWVELFYDHPTAEIRHWPINGVRPTAVDAFAIDSSTATSTQHHVILSSGSTAGFTGPFAIDEIDFLFDGLCH